MKIAVIAANGRSGQVFVEAALKAGHTVRAGIRGKSYLVAHERLEIINCDATKQWDVLKLVDHQDAVVSLIGHVKNSPANVQATAMRKTIVAMEQKHIKRFVTLTGTGVRFEGDHITLLDRFLNFGVGVVDPKRIQDGKDFVDILKRSELDWTLLRVLKLANVDPSKFTLQANGPTKLYVGRVEVAQAILQVLEDQSFIKQAPIISK